MDMVLTKYRLQDIADVEISGVDKKILDGETPIRLCNFTDVYYNWAITEEKAKSFLVASANTREINKFRLRKGMVALTKDSETRFDIGISTYIADDLEGVILGYHCALVTPLASSVNGKYLNAFISSSYIKQYCANSANGSGQRYSLPISVLKNMPILLPSIKEQQAIGNLLSLIDRKTTLNRAINHNLEAMAKQLYDYWFVQFDFPDENGKPYKSSGSKMIWNEKIKREIPEGWTASNICRIADIRSGGTPSKAVPEYWKDGVIPFFAPTDFNGNIFQIETVEHITQNGLSRCASSLFEEGTIIITARGSIGKLVIVGTPMAMNQSCYALQSKEHKSEYLYFLTIQLIEYLKAKGSGSVFKSIIASDIEASLLCIADVEIITRFCTTIGPLLQKIKQNTLETLELTKLRDELLPLLMNGQVSVNYDLSHD